jgi:tetratricopeptide (TPR) repeat protein
MNESSYWDLHEQAVDAFRRGKLAESEEAFALNQRRARENQLPGLADRAYCNWAAIRLERNQLAGLRPGLSRVLGESSDLKARQLAAYNLATCYRLQGNLRGARFYAEMAGRLAETLGDEQVQASSLHCLGLLWIAESRLETARDCLRKSLELRVKQEMSVHTALTISAYGYCAALLGDWAESLWLMDESQAALETLPCGIYEPAIRLSLGFAHLERGESEEALDQGLTALKVIDHLKVADEEKFARYLVGESLAQKGDVQEALDHFEILQKTFFPEHTDLPEVLVSVRTSQWLNWLAS